MHLSETKTTIEWRKSRRLSDYELYVNGKYRGRVWMYWPNDWVAVDEDGDNVYFNAPDCETAMDALTRYCAQD